MLTTRKTPRRKQFSHKVRTGCITCRRRRIKCDETKPSCTRCQKAGYTCQGYQATIIFMFEPAKAPRPLQSFLQAQNTIAMPMPSHETDDALRSLQYYHEQFCPVILTAFPKSEDFWINTLPQAARAHQPVMHCLTSAALSSEDKISITASDCYIKPRKKFHYTAGLRMLARGSVSLDIMLFGCIALFMFSTCERNEDHARLHLNNGFRMIDAYRAQKEAGTCTLLAEQSELVEQTCQGFFNTARGILSYIFPSHITQEASPHDTRPFPDEGQAVDQLVNIARLIDQPLVTPEQLLERLTTWVESFDAMKRRAPPSRLRVIMMFHKCVDRTVDLFAAGADDVVRPSRLRFTLGLMNALAESSIADASMLQGLCILLGKIEQGFDIHEEHRSVQTIRIHLQQRLHKPIVPYS